MKENSDSAVMTGEKTARSYLTAQKIIGKAYLGKFYQILTSFGKKGRFLEIGSGPGYQTATIMEEFHPDEIVVIEPSRDMISAASGLMAQRGIKEKVDFHPGFVEDESLIHGLGKFDLIYSTLSLHHWANPVQAFRNLVLALNPDGVIVIHDFQRFELPFHLDLHFVPTRPGHRTYSAGEIGGLISAAGIFDYKRIPCFPFQIIVIKKSDLEAAESGYRSILTLDKLYPGQEASILDIKTDEERVRELARLGVSPSVNIRVVMSDPHNVIFGLQQRRIAIDRDTASGIIVDYSPRISR